jgi:hypothetical protein
VSVWEEVAEDNISTEEGRNSREVVGNCTKLKKLKSLYSLQSIIRKI